MTTPSKWLFVGDPHARVEDLDDCANLMKFVTEVAQKEQVNKIVFLGDLHHNHALVHIRVTEFWTRQLEALAESTIPLDGGDGIILLKGNHDEEANSKSRANALLSYRNLRNVVVVDEPDTIERVLFVPYQSHDEMKSLFKGPYSKSVCHTMVCHAEFSGAQYENGLYAPHGLNPDDIPVNQIISGHIHKPQEFGKVKYLGSPRWITAGDGNQDRFIWTANLNNGVFSDWNQYFTDGAVSRIEVIEDREGLSEPPQILNPHWRYTVNIKGSAAYVESRSAFWAGKAKIRTNIIRSKRVEVKESEGIGTAFKKYFDNFEPKFGTPKDKLYQLVTSRLRG